jgi:hypothetical protein
VLLAGITCAIVCVGVVTSALFTPASAQTVSSAQQLVYFTLFPGAVPVALAPGPSGTIYIAGVAFPTSGFLTTPNALQSQDPDGQNPAIFLAILDPSRSGGAQLVYSTFFGGSGFQSSQAFTNDGLSGLAVDKAGRAYLCGQTASGDFPLSSGALQSTNPFAANPLRKRKQVPPSTGYFAVIDPSRSGSAQLVHSTYLGGSNGPTSPSAVNIDNNGRAYLTGFTVASDFPLTGNAFQRKQRLFKSDFTNSFTNAFVTVIDPAGSGPSSLVYSSYLGGAHLSAIRQVDVGLPQGDAGYAIAPGSRGLVYVAGQTATTDFPVTSAFQRPFQSHIVESEGGTSNEFLTVLNPQSAAGRVSPQSQLAYSTYLGGNSFSLAISVAVDSRGIATVGGQEFFGTGADAFPTTPGAFQRSPSLQFATTISRVNPFKQGKASLLYSTLFFPTALFPISTSLAVDSKGFAYAVGSVDSPQEFPITADAFQPTFYPVGNEFAGFLSILDPLASGNAALLYSTFLGHGLESPQSVAVDSTGKVYIAGLGGGGSFPTTPGAFSDSGSMYVAILSPPIP